MLSLVKSLFSLSDIDVGILQSINFDIDISEGADLLLQQAQHMRNLILLIKWDEKD